MAKSIPREGGARGSHDTGSRESFVGENRDSYDNGSRHSDVGETRDFEESPGHPDTRRQRERAQENREYVPVIIKRTDEVRRHPDDILETAVHEGEEQLKRGSLSLFLSAAAAGLILSSTVMAVALGTMLSANIDNPLAQRLIPALLYPLGFVICIMSGTELFTEHTATAVYPVLDGRSRWPRLIRLWAFVLAGNLTGALVGAALLILGNDVIHAKAGYVEIGTHLVAYPTGALFVSAILAGWLMALGAWLILATPPTVSQIVSIYIVTFLIGFGGLHHSIAGAVEMFAALMASDQFTLKQAARFITVAVLGNLVGGSFFVAVLNYGHIRKSRSSPRR